MTDETTAERVTPLRAGVASNTDVTLDQVTIRDIELVTVRKKLAETEVQLAKVILQDTLQKQKQVQIDEAAVLATLETKLGRKITGSIQLLDREKGLCRIG